MRRECRERFPRPPQVSDPGMHHSTCVTHMPRCMPGSLTSGFLWNRWLEKTFPAFPAHAQPAILRTVKCHYNACHYSTNASLTRSILGSQTAPTCPHDHPRVAQHMGYRCEIMAVSSATAAMTPLCSHTNGIKQRHPTCWLCQYSGFMINLRSNTLIIHLRCSENAINKPIWLPDARMLKTISVAIKLT